MTVDYEVEYNNRARVPEHPEIFARWQREGAAYRAAAQNAKLGISYGPSSRRTIDLFSAKDDDKAPLAVREAFFVSFLGQLGIGADEAFAAGFLFVSILIG